MSQDRAIEVIESCYRQIASGGAALRLWQKQYIAHLDAARSRRSVKHSTPPPCLRRKTPPFTRSGSRLRLRRTGLTKAALCQRVLAELP